MKGWKLKQKRHGWDRECRGRDIGGDEGSRRCRVYLGFSCMTFYLKLRLKLR